MRALNVLKMSIFTRLESGKMQKCEGLKVRIFLHHKTYFNFLVGCMQWLKKEVTCLWFFSYKKEKCILEVTKPSWLWGFILMKRCVEESYISSMVFILSCYNFSDWFFGKRFKNQQAWALGALKSMECEDSFLLFIKF